jgi:hypothetical protein
MRKPLHAFFNLSNQRPAAPTFGQERAQKLTQRLTNAVTERRKLARAEATSQDPLQTTYNQRGQMVERRIDRLHAELQPDGSETNK